MQFTNSSLVSYTRLSPNHSGQRTHKIDRITPHCIVGNLSLTTIGAVFAPAKKNASCQYGISLDGGIGLYCEEKNRSWCTSSAANDQRAVTIECSSSTKHPYEFKSVVFESLVKLCIDICQRNGKDILLWMDDKEAALSYNPKDNEMVLTAHRWFASKSCPGDWMYERMGDLADRVNAVLSESKTPEEDHLHGTQMVDLQHLTDSLLIDKMGPIFTADQKATGILAAISMAQFILESRLGKSELATAANNLFGMKEKLSGNTWAGSHWDGKSVYTKPTTEQKPSGETYTVTASFRKYCCIEDCIADHSAYLLGAMKGDKLRYEGLKGCADYKDAARILKDGGYATAVDYVAKLCEVVERYGLTKFNLEAEIPKNLYRVRKTWENSKTQKGAFVSLDNAVACATKNTGYKVYDYAGHQVYPEVPTYVLYTVERGDSLWLIAEKYLHNGAKYPEIKALNGMKSNLILPGDVLKIPVQQGAMEDAPAESKPEPIVPWTPKRNEYVKVVAGAKWYGGQKISPWVMNKTWRVVSVSGNRVVLGKSSDGLNNIQSPIDVKYLKKV